MLSNDVMEYVELHRNLGFKFRSQSLLLRNFVVFAEPYCDTVVQRARVLDWAIQAPSAAQQRNRLLTVRRFAIAMHLENESYEVPPDDAFGHASFRRGISHIYTEDEIRRLIEAALLLKPVDSIRPLTYAALFALLISTGLRISEALSLNVSDITEDGLIVRSSKFRKSRLVPLHETTREGLERYLMVRLHAAPLSMELFVSKTGTALKHSTVNGVFLRLARSIGLRKAPGHRGPRIHDMRHNSENRIIPRKG